MHGIAHPEVEFVVIGAYLALMIVIGVVFKRFSVNADDFFRGGARGTWWMVGTSSFMAGISALTFTGNGGAAFEAGWSIMLIYLANCLALLLHVCILAPWFRQLRATTFPEVLRSRFNPLTQQIYAYVWMVLFLLQGAIWLWGLAIFTSVVFGLSIDLVIPVLGLVVLFYSATGGRWAVMAADFVQGLIMMGMTILIAVLCLIKFGGLGGLLSRIQEAGLTEQFALIKPLERVAANGAYSWKWAVAVMAVQVITMCSLQSSAKYFSVKDSGGARRAALLTLALMAGGMLAWFIPPVAARLLYAPEVMASGMSKPGEAAFAIISVKLLPIGLVGMMVVAMFSATMSSMDAGLNGNSGMFVKDMLPSLARLFRRPPASEAHQLRIGRVTTVVFGLVIILLAQWLAVPKAGKGVFEMALQLASLVVVPMTLPLLLCLFVRKVPAWAAIASAATTIVPSAMATFARTPWALHEQVFWVTLTGAGTFFATRLFWRTANPTYRHQVDEFFARMHKPVDFEQEVGKSNDSQQLRIMGRFTGAIAIFTALLLVVQNPLAGRVSILALAVTLGLIGILLLRAAKKQAAMPPSGSTEAPKS